MNEQRHLRRVPPAPGVIAQLYADYKRATQGLSLSFRDYLQVIGFTDADAWIRGRDTGAARGFDEKMALVAVPHQEVKSPLKLLVLLVDFADVPATRPAREFEDMLFSQQAFLTGSLRDYYAEVTRGSVDVDGTVHGWLRMPQPYSYYVANQSGVGPYPHNAQKLAEDAVRAAMEEQVPFPADLDNFGQGTITALFLVHAGPGAEVMTSKAQQARYIWSHKADFEVPVAVGGGLQATNYLTVPENCRMGVCAHELGHLAFQWDDFYDPNYDEDGSYWAGSGNWDLMAGGSWNGGGNTPAHPAGLHKSQHGWVEVLKVTATQSGVVLPPYRDQDARVVRIESAAYGAKTRCLILENRARQGFDSQLPGEGLLVWRVDTSLEMTNADHPAMLLVQADGLHDLERPGDFNEGDAGDPFPGTGGHVALPDTGEPSTSFPGEPPSGVTLQNIARAADTGTITLDIVIT